MNLVNVSGGERFVQFCLCWILFKNILSGINYFVVQCSVALGSGTEFG